MKKITYLLLCCYGIVAIADIYFTLVNHPPYRNITKPLLMPLLMLAVFSETGFRNKLSFLFVSALFFSWAGDVILMFDNLFTAGLVSFLIAQLLYLAYFIRIKGPKGMIQYQPLFAIPIFVYWLLLCGLLNDFLDTFKIPVFIYGAVICAVWGVCWNLFWKIDRKTAALFFFGSFQFVLSDSILAVHRFVYPFDILPALVMITYCSAQFLLTLGCIRYLYPILRTCNKNHIITG